MNKSITIGQWTYSGTGAHYTTPDGVDAVVIVPDEIANNQEPHDAQGTTFPAIFEEYFDAGRYEPFGNVRLDGNAYGLNTPGTGDMIVVDVED